MIFKIFLLEASEGYIDDFLIRIHHWKKKLLEILGVEMEG